MENQEQEIELTADQKALLETEFSPEIEKIAEQQLDSMDCADALFTFGQAKAEVELYTAGGNEEKVQEALEKQAAASEIIETKMKAIRAHNFEAESQLDEAGLEEVLVKEASAAAQIIADGYFSEYHQAAEENPELVKEAAAMGALKGVFHAAKADAGKAAKYVGEKAKGAAGKAKEMGGKAIAHAKAGAHKAHEMGKKGVEHAKAGAKKAHEAGKKGGYHALGGAAAGAGGMSLYQKHKEKH